jgi:hypothetical protein
MTHYDSDIFTDPMHPGWVLEMRMYHDDDADPPWERQCLLGEVREVRASRYTCHTHATGKQPGEKVLDWTGRWGRAYDWRGAVAQGRKAGYSGPDAVKQADREFDYLRRWLADQWHYCGVAVRIISCPPQYKACLDDQDEYAHALWGIESDATDYLKETARELGDEAVKAVKAAHAAVKTCPTCGHRSNPAG